MAERHDVVIVGAGVVGLAAAGALARAGRRVLLIDRGEPFAEASAASAGMLAPHIEAHAGDALLPLGLVALGRYPDLTATCAAAGFHICHNTRGIVHLATAENEVALRAQLEAQRAFGLDTQWLDGVALRQRHPGVGPDARGALLAPRDGCVDSIVLGRALVAAAQEAGVVFVAEEVCEIRSRSGRVTGVRGAINDFRADWVVLAAGAWACTIAGLPLNVPVEPVRGQMAALPWPAREPQSVLYGDAGYLVPRGRDALVGATMEHVGFQKGTTEAGLEHLRSAAVSLLPSLAAAAFTRSWSGLRPMTPDGLPIIGLDRDLQGLVYATGHGRNGILLGPLTGEIVMDLVVRGESRWDIAACSIVRFGR